MRKIYDGLNPLQADTVFYYAADLLNDLKQGKLTETQEVDVYLVLGTMFKKLNAKFLGTEYLNRAFDHYKQLGFEPSRYLILLYANLASTLPNDSANHEKALHYYHTAYSLSLQTGQQLYSIGNLNNIGLHYYNRGNQDTALSYYRRAMRTYSEEYEQFHPVELAIRNNIATILLEEKQSQQALSLYKKNRQIIRQKTLIKAEKSNPRKVSSSLGMAAAYIQLARYDSAQKMIQYADSIIPILPLNHWDKFINLSYAIKIDLYEHIADKKELAKLSRRFLSLKDSLNQIKLDFASQAINAMGQIQMDFANLRIDSQKQQLHQSRLRNSLILAGLLIATLIIISGYLNARKNRQQVKAQEELSKVNLQNVLLKEEKLKLRLRNQSRDLREISGQVVFFRELHSQINDKLKNVDSSDPENQKETMSALSKQIKRNLKEVNVTGLLQDNLKRVNSSFYHKLDRQTGERLSSVEKEVAALLRLGISDNQIAELRGTSMSAVRVTRHRIKQKLSLKKEDSLSHFLSEI